MLHPYDTDTGHGRLIGTEDKTMRTLLIPPSFLAVFAVIIFAVGWLITNAMQQAPDSVSQPSRSTFTSWYETMPVHQSVPEPSKTATREYYDEIGEF